MVTSGTVLGGGEAVTAKLEVVWIWPWAERKRCACRADLNRCHVRFQGLRTRVSSGPYPRLFLMQASAVEGGD